MTFTKNRPLPKGFLAHPTVFAVADSYQIMLPVDSEMFVGVKVGGETYYDEYNGVIRSSSPIHRVILPASELDAAKEYTVTVRRVIERRAYRSRTEEEELYTYSFRPLEKTEGIKIYHISDTHGRVDFAVSAALSSGETPDILILNGDVMNASETLDQIVDVYRIASAITEGEIPCVFSRGNHDFRGSYAEKLADYVPADNGNTFFTFKLGPVWGLVLDCGEDKFDDHYEYGHSVSCDGFRKRETSFIRKVCEGKEFDRADVKYKLVVCHIPFSNRPGKGNYGYVDNPFLVGEELYTEWGRIIKEGIAPDILLTGHCHTCRLIPVGGPYDQRGQPANGIIGGKPRTLDGERDGFSGASVILMPEEATVIFNDNEGNASEPETLKYKAR